MRREFESAGQIWIRPKTKKPPFRKNEPEQKPNAKFWLPDEVSNLEPSDPESDALPIELSGNECKFYLRAAPGVVLAREVWGILTFAGDLAATLGFSASLGALFDWCSVRAQLRLG